MNNPMLLSLLSMLYFASHQCPAQTIQVFDKGDNTYLIDNEVHHYRDMAAFFHGDPVQADLYKGSVSELNQARNAGYFSGVVLGTGLLALAIDGRGPDYCDLICITAGQVIFGASLIVLPIGLIIRVASLYDYRNKKKQLLALYNSTNDQSLLQRANANDYTFSASKTGLGIVMHF